MSPLLKILLRALGATAVICLVALIAGAFRLQRLSVTGLRIIASENWRVAIMVFLGVTVWEFWFRRAAKLEASDRASRDSKSRTSR
jgi:hypothetical protein